MPTAKHMQTLGQEIYAELSRKAERKGISVQQPIRAVIIPDWIRTQERPTRLRRTRVHTIQSNLSIYTQRLALRQLLSKVSNHLLHGRNVKRSRRASSEE